MFASGGTAGNEIFIGYTESSFSNDYIKSLSSADYGYKIMGDKALVIGDHTDSATKKAAKQFVFQINAGNYLTEMILNVIYQLSPKGEIPQVNACFFTHLHSDHYGARYRRYKDKRLPVVQSNFPAKYTH